MAAAPARRAPARPVPPASAHRPLRPRRPERAGHGETVCRARVVLLPPRLLPPCPPPCLWAPTLLVAAGRLSGVSAAICPPTTPAAPGKSQVGDEPSVGGDSVIVKLARALNPRAALRLPLSQHSSLAPHRRPRASASDAARSRARSPGRRARRSAALRH